MYFDSADVVVIGAGVSGLTSAYYLAKGGKDVVVVEKGIVGGEASGRNAGFISVAVDQGDVAATAVESLKIWPTLHEELGYPTEFVHQGKALVALTEEDMETVVTMKDNYIGYGLRGQVLDPDEVRELIPGISDRVLGGFYSPDGGHANPQRTVQAFAWGFRDRGGRLYQRTAVTGITLEGGRVASVETTAGSIETEFVVSAAGPQTGHIGEMVGVFVPVAPARMESIATVPLEPMFNVTLIGNGVYARQSLKGNVMFGGGPFEWVDVALDREPAKPNTPIIRNIAKRMAELVPGLEDQRLIRAWAGIVEVTPDGNSIIDMPGEPEGFVLVTQHHGFGPSPGTGLAVSQLILDGESSVDISGFKLSRFDWLDRDWRRKWGFRPGDYGFEGG